MEHEIAGFDWDVGNSSKCLKHGVTRAEIEAAFRRRPLMAPNPAYVGSELRFIAISENAEGRPTFIAFTYRRVGNETPIRPIGARYMHAKERKRYEARTQDED
jgi:uncharacterized protein